MDNPLLEGTALLELLRQIGAMVGSTFGDQVTNYVAALEEQLKEFPQGSEERTQTLKLIRFVQGFDCLERSSLLGERISSPAKLRLVAAA